MRAGRTAVLVLLLFAVLPVVIAFAVQAEGVLNLRPYFPERVRARIDYHATVEAYWDGPRGDAIRLQNMRLLCGERVLMDRDLDLVLSGDGGWFRRLNDLLESLPPEYGYRYTHRQTPVTRQRDPAEIQATITAAREMIEAARRDPYRRGHPSVALLDFDMPVTALFDAEELRPGRTIPLAIVVTYADGQGEKSKALRVDLDVAEEFPRLSSLGGGDLSGTWYQGDLHVHYCKDEASLFGERGCPDCQAEALNWGDDNTLAQLKSQYQALGAEWFTITSHSYCINSDTEYGVIRDDCASLSGPDFQLIPDTELSSDEEGPLVGDDLFDLTCANGVNHMGAHWITQRKPGGDDGVLAFCNEPKYGFTENLAQIQAEGGFGAINHPAAGSFGWNSVEMTHGFQAGGFHGVEVWNGPLMSGQGGNVGWWVDMLLRGEKLYCCSGSDTHDDAFDFGWNHVYLTGALNSRDLKNALMQGHSYVSNYQALAIAGRIPRSPWQLMGGEIIVPVAGSTPIQLVVDYNMGSYAGNVTVFEGHVGDGAETVLRTLTGLTGVGRRVVSDVAWTGGLSYYRLYSEIPGQQFYAYSNPLWVRPQ